MPYQIDYRQYITMKKIFDPTIDDNWGYGPLFEVHVRFLGGKLEEFTQSEIDRVFALLGIPEIYSDCTSIGEKKNINCLWNGSEMSYGLWCVSENLTLAIQVRQDYRSPNDLWLLVPTRQMEAVLGIHWDQELRQCVPDVVQLNKDIICAFRRLHAHFPLKGVLISEETWFYQIPTNAQGIYLATLAAEAIDPQRIVKPSDENLANVQCGKPGLRIIPLDSPPSAS